MKIQQDVSKITQKSDVIVFALATLIVCILVGKGVFSLCETECGTEQHSLLHEVKK